MATDDDYTPPDYSSLSENKPIKSTLTVNQGSSDDDYVSPDYSGLVAQTTEDNVSKPEKKISDYDQAIKSTLGLGGNAIGAYSAYKGKSLPNPLNLLKPGENVFSSGPIKPITKNDLNIQENNLPNIDNYDDEITNIMHSIDPNLKSTGRQRQEGYNGETQRRSLANKANLAADPSAANMLVNSGPMVPATDSGVVIPQYDAYLMEQKRLADLRNQAQQIYADKQMAAQKAAQQSLDLENANNAAQKSEKVSGIIKGGNNIANKAIGTGAALSGAYNVYDDLSNKRDSGYGQTASDIASTVGGLLQMTPYAPAKMLGTALQIPASGLSTVKSLKSNTPEDSYEKYTKPLSTAGLAAMLFPGAGDIVGGLMQIPEMVRQGSHLPDYYNPATDKKMPHAH
jgi:hypothetical protein